MFTKESLLREFKKSFLELIGYELDIPVKFGAMYSTRAYFSHTTENPLCFKISNECLDGRWSDEDVMKIMRHEIVHYAVFKKYGYNIKPHGKEYEEECKLLNVEFFIYSSFPLLHNNFPRIICSKCGVTLKSFSTAKQALKYIYKDNFGSSIRSKCCYAECEVKEKE